jgi:hypothetical protein
LINSNTRDRLSYLTRAGCPREAGRTEHHVPDDQEQPCPAREHARTHRRDAEHYQPDQERPPSQHGERTGETRREHDVHRRSGGSGDLDQHDPGDERRTHHTEHHPQASQQTAPLGLCSVQRHECEDERYVRCKH